MTSHSRTPIPHTAGTYQPRAPLRLTLSPSPGQSGLDGSWWPQSRDLDHELADLADNFPPDFGRVQRVLYSPPDWDTRPQSVLVGRGRLETGSFSGDDTHMMLLRMSTRTDLRLLVVPPDHPVGDQAMSIAADPSNRWSTRQILAAGAFDEVGDSGDHWTDDGASWWRHPEAGPRVPVGPSGDGHGTWAHETSLAAEKASASRARDFVRKHLAEHDLTFLEGSLQLVVSELASNAVQHARTAFTVNLSGDGSSVLLAVRDDSSAEPLLRPPSGTRTRGRGLMIVDQLSDDWGVENSQGNAKSVWARFLTS